MPWIIHYTQLSVMQIIHTGRKCISFVVSAPNIVILLIVAIDVCTSSGDQNTGSLNTQLNEGSSVAYEPIEKLNIWNISFDDKEYFLQYTTNKSENISVTTKLGPYLALSAFHERVDPEFVALINPFWLKFNPAPANAHYIYGIVHASLMTIGLFGNALVIFMFIRCRSLRTPCNILIINLAISDFCMLAKAPIVIYNSFKLGPALGDAIPTHSFTVCRIYGFIGGLTGTASIATLTAISIDRYNVVVYPLEPLRSTTSRKSKIMVFIVWCYSFTFSIIPALNIGFSKYVPEGYLTSCSFDYLDKTLKARIFMFVFFIFAWFLPFTIITYCYVYILKVVRSSRHIRSSMNKHKTDIKLSKVVVGVIILWFVAWTPYAIVALLGISGNEEKISPFGSMIPALFCKASACINPYVYSFSHPRFRTEFYRLFLNRDDIGKAIATSYYQCNPTGNPSIIHKCTTSEINVVNSIKFRKTKLETQNLSFHKKIECETSLSTKVRDSKKKDDVVVFVETYSKKMDLLNVVKE